MGLTHTIHYEQHLYAVPPNQTVLCIRDVSQPNTSAIWSMKQTGLCTFSKGSTRRMLSNLNSWSFQPTLRLLRELAPEFVPQQQAQEQVARLEPSLLLAVAQRPRLLGLASFQPW